MNGGTSKLVFDTQRLGAIGGPLQLETPGYADQTDHYDIEIGSGASSVTIQAR